jgi:hypothetical protein
VWDFIKITSKKKQIKMNHSKSNQAQSTKTAAAIACTLLLLSGSQLLSPAHAAPASITTSERESNPGYLEVFSSTESYQWGEGSVYYPHTGYRIFDASGKAVRWIDNNSASSDEQPEKVELPSGTYTVWAQSDRKGYVLEKVVIQPFRVTTVQLEQTKNAELGINRVAAK